VRLHSTLAPPRDVIAFRIVPNGSRVVYLADQDVDGVLELYLTSPGRRQAALLPR